jgi:MYXO-CTERM domain-containing protein
LWVLDDTGLHGIDPTDGGVVEILPNAAADCEIPGTGVSSSGDGQLTLVCTDGRWFEVSSDDGSVISSGNNGLDMWGSGFFKGPECGDEVVDRGELCDTGGESVSCDVDCSFAACGDGVWNQTAAEECDDANLQAGDGCSPSCTVEVSGTDEGIGTSEETSTTADDGVVDSTTAESTTDAESADGPVPDTSAAMEESTAADSTGGGVSGCGCASANGSKNVAFLGLVVFGALACRRRAYALP